MVARQQPQGKQAWWHASCVSPPFFANLWRVRGHQACIDGLRLSAGERAGLHGKGGKRQFSWVLPRCSCPAPAQHSTGIRFSPAGSSRKTLSWTAGTYMTRCLQWRADRSSGPAGASQGVHRLRVRAPAAGWRPPKVGLQRPTLPVPLGHKNLTCSEVVSTPAKGLGCAILCASRAHTEA